MSYPLPTYLRGRDGVVEEGGEEVGAEVTNEQTDGVEREERKGVMHYWQGSHV